MNKNVVNERKDLLCECLVEIQNKEEAYEFLVDLCSVGEFESLVQRVLVAQKLKAGKMYAEIVEEVGASTATISRVSHAWKESNGYRKILERIENKDVQ